MAIRFTTISYIDLIILIKVYQMSSASMPSLPQKIILMVMFWDIQKVQVVKNIHGTIMDPLGGKTLFVCC